MSLDVTLTAVRPMEVYSGNITHNLNKMAMEVWVGDRFSEPVTLYSVLWRPDELAIPITKASELADYLDMGFNELLADPEKYKQFEASNGWGTYDGLLNFVYMYRNACWNNPDATISISR